MKNYKAVIFDFDMTIADSEKTIVFCLQRTMEHFGYPVREYEDSRTIIGNTAAAMLAYMSGETDKEKISEMRAWYRQLSITQSRKIKFFPGVGEGLRLLREKGIKTGILSLKSSQVIRPLLERDGILPYLDKITGGDQVSSPKPDPEGLLSMIDAFGLSKDETLYVGDSLVDQVTAQNGGVNFGAMLLGATTLEQFSKAPLAEAFNSFDDLLKTVLFFVDRSKPI